MHTFYFFLKRVTAYKARAVKIPPVKFDNVSTKKLFISAVNIQKKK